MALFATSEVVTASKMNAVTPVPAVALPGSPINGQLAILTDSTTAPTYAWTFRYSTDITDANKWMFVGGAPFVGSTYTIVHAGIYRAVYGGMWGNGGTTSPATHAGLLRNNAVTEATVTIEAVNSNDTGTGSRQRVSAFYGDGTITVTTVGHVIDTSGIDTPIMALWPVRVA